MAVSTATRLTAGAAGHCASGIPVKSALCTAMVALPPGKIGVLSLRISLMA
jgi:hypothetical protein